MRALATQPGNRFVSFVRASVRACEAVKGYVGNPGLARAAPAAPRLWSRCCPGGVLA